MNHPKTPLPALAAAVLLAGTGASQASTLGLYDGSFVTTWDNFSSATATAEAPDAASPNYSAVLNLAVTGGIPAGGGARIYSFGAAFNFTVTGSLAIDVPELSLVLKFTSPGNAPNTPANYFSVAFADGPAVTPIFLGTATNDANTFNIYQYNLGAYTSGSALDVRVTSPAGDHVSMDAIQLVPEPSTSLLAGLMGLGLVLRRRRK